MQIIDIVADNNNIICFGPSSQHTIIEGVPYFLSILQKDVIVLHALKKELGLSFNTRVHSKYLFNGFTEEKTAFLMLEFKSRNCRSSAIAFLEEKGYEIYGCELDTTKQFMCYKQIHCFGYLKQTETVCYSDAEIYHAYGNNFRVSFVNFNKEHGVIQIIHPEGFIEIATGEQVSWRNTMLSVARELEKTDVVFGIELASLIVEVRKYRNISKLNRFPVTICGYCIDVPGRFFVDIGSLLPKNTPANIESLVQLAGLQFDSSISTIELLVEAIDALRSIDRLIVNCALLHVRPCDTLNYTQSGNLMQSIRCYMKDTHTAKFAVKKEEKKGYQGGKVLLPEVGFIDKTMAVFDFKSHYPSIIISYNICPSTMVPANSMTKDACNISPCGVWFVKKSVRRGVIPGLLQDWIEKRTTIKQNMKMKENAASLVTLSMQEQCYKLFMNMVYGNFGFANSDIFDERIASAVTSWGAHSLESVCSQITDNFVDSRVVYGHTDSLVIEVKDEENANNILEHVKASGVLIGIQELELEEIWDSCYFFSANRYAYKIENEIKTKGLLTNNLCKAAQKTLVDALHLLFYANEYEAVAHIKNMADRFEEYTECNIGLTGLIKKPLYKYPETNVPKQVQAARKVQDFKGNKITYYMSTSGPMPISNYCKENVDKGYYKAHILSLSDLFSSRKEQKRNTLSSFKRQKKESLFSQL